MGNVYYEFTALLLTSALVGLLAQIGVTVLRFVVGLKLDLHLVRHIGPAASLRPSVIRFMPSRNRPVPPSKPPMDIQSLTAAPVADPACGR